jgi:L,D-transpeptidase catalytic domain
MRGRAVMLAAALACFINVETAEAKLDILVDKATQRMIVIQDGYIRYMWPVSTGRDNMQTPNGVYAPQRLERNWFSTAYYDSPMPFSIFFHNGYAIHGSYAIDRLGGPASHGCVRLHPHHAAILFDLVQQEGPDRTTIEIADADPRAEPSLSGREVASLRGVSPPEPRTERYREAVDVSHPPPPQPPGNRAIVARNVPPRPSLVAARMPAAGESDAPGGFPRRPRELISRFKPRVVEGPPATEPPKVIEAPRVAERSTSEAAPSASGFRLLPASCWSGGASRWQWWASGQQNPCR